MKEFANLFPIFLAGMAWGAMLMGILLYHAPRLRARIERGNHAAPVGDQPSIFDLCVWERREKTHGRFRIHPAIDSYQRTWLHRGGVR